MQFISSSENIYIFKTSTEQYIKCVCVCVCVHDFIHITRIHTHALTYVADHLFILMALQIRSLLDFIYCFAHSFFSKPSKLIGKLQNMIKYIPKTHTHSFRWTNVLLFCNKLHTLNNVKRSENRWRGDELFVRGSSCAKPTNQNRTESDSPRIAIAPELVPVLLRCTIYIS